MIYACSTVAVVFAILGAWSSAAVLVAGVYLVLTRTQEQ